MPDSQVIHIETGDEEAADRVEAAQVLQAEPVQWPDTRPVPTDPFDDLQPMLDLRFPEEPGDIVTASVPDEIIVLPDDAEAARVILLSDETTLVPEDAPVEALAEPVDETTVLEASADDTQDEVAVLNTEETSTAEPLLAQSEPMPPDVADIAPQDQPHGDWDTNQKIADEANATAQALETLKQLIAHKMPGIEIDPQAVTPAEEPVRPPPIQAFASEPASPEPNDDVMPAIPAFIGEPPNAGRGTAWQGFLAGFMASWAIGAALYAYLVFA
jgi:hypothetical protein